MEKNKMLLKTLVFLCCFYFFSSDAMVQANEMDVDVGIELLVETTSSSKPPAGKKPPIKLPKTGQETSIGKQMIGTSLIVIGGVLVLRKRGDEK